jgi:hypothetical protein
MDFLLKILYYDSSGVSVRLISFFFLAGLYNNSPSETWVHIEIIPIFTVCDCCSKVLPSEKAVSEVAAAGGVSYCLVSHLRNSAASLRCLGPPVDSLLRRSSTRPMNWTGMPSIFPVQRPAKAPSKWTPEIAVSRSMRLGLGPNWTIWSGLLRSWREISKLPNSNARDTAKVASAFSRVARRKKSMSEVERGCP